MSRRMRICLGVKFMAFGWVLAGGRHDRGAVEFGKALTDRRLERAKLLTLLCEETGQGGIADVGLAGVASEERPEPGEKAGPHAGPPCPGSIVDGVAANGLGHLRPRPAGAGDRRQGDQPPAVRHEGDLEIPARAEPDEWHRQIEAGCGLGTGVGNRFGESNHDGVLSAGAKGPFQGPKAGPFDLGRRWRPFDRFPFGSGSRIRSGNVTPNGNRSAGYGRFFPS